jgi:Copper amine oxidase N-terminal domain
VRGGSVLVPLRSMFEQMGATVNYDPGTKTVDVMKPGSDVKVAVGKPEVIVNGESRPLDVPPEIYKGVLLVPLRVLSEGMGAYVQWVPDKRTVVVRYLSAAPPAPPTPEATPAPTEVPATPAPAATPTPAPPVKVKSKYEKFVVGDYIFSARTFNAISPGNTASSFAARAAVEFPLFNLPWMLEGDFRSYRYPHPTDGTGVCPSFDQSCVNAIGNQGQVYVPTFNARDDDFDGRFGLKVADPRIYIGIGYIFRNSNYEGGAFATQSHGLGFGAEKLPDLDEPFSLYGSVYYYPFVTTNGNQNLGGGFFGSVQYRVLKYAIGGTFNFGNSPLFFDFGYLGDRVYNKQNAPIDEQHNGPYAGLGIHF